MFYGQTEPVDSISEPRFAIGPTVIEIYSKAFWIVKYPSRKMHCPSCASGRIGHTGRKLKIMTEATIAPTSGWTAPNPDVEGAHHDNTLLDNTILDKASYLSISLSNISGATSDALNSLLRCTAFMHFQRNSIFSANYRLLCTVLRPPPSPSASRLPPSALRLCKQTTLCPTLPSKFD